MIRILRSVALLVLAATVTVGAARAETTLTTSWNKGFRLSSEDGQFKLKFGGRIQNDWAWFDQDGRHLAAFGNWQDGTEFRRMRLYVAGHIYDYVTFKAQYDFAGAGKAGKEVVVKDMYVGVSKIPMIGSISAGNQYEPIGLETMTSSKYITFMERSLTTAFLPERNGGIRQHGAYADGRVTVSAGLFRDTDGGGRNAGDGDYSGTVRVTALPYHETERGDLVHVGAAFSRRTPGTTVEYDADPASHLAETSVSTGALDADAVNLFGGEGAVVYGRFSAQGEYVLASVDADSLGDPSFSAYYAYASVFLTGEHRPYKTSGGVFSRVSPRHNFRQDDKGVGAWELAVRYASLDLNDGAVAGGELTDITVGLNWYLNPNTRIMFNYVRSEVDKVGVTRADQGAANIIETRFQVDF